MLFRSVPFIAEVVPLEGLGFVVTVIWLVAMTNLINLIDGIDGLAAGIGVMLMALLAWVGFSTAGGLYSMLCIGVLGALLGFLRFNFPPARIYMGDGGAYFIGFFIGAVSIETSNKGTVLAALAGPMLALALPVIDTTLALLRRGSKGLPLFRPDLEHIHHRLINRGVTKTKAVLTLYALSLLAMGFGIAAFAGSGRHIPVLIGLAAAAMVLALQWLNLIPSLSAARTVLKGHWKLRKHSRYLLTLSSWLGMEAERCASLDLLWADFRFLANKVGMARVRLRLNGVERSWAGLEQEPSPWVCKHLCPSVRLMEMEFHYPRSRFSEQEVNHITSLASEAWYKAVLTWEKAHGRDGVLTTEAAPAERRSRQTVPAPEEQTEGWQDAVSNRLAPYEGTVATEAPAASVLGAEPA